MDYCGGVDTTSSIDRLTHGVHGLYRQLDNPARVSNKDPPFPSFLLSLASDACM